MSSRKKKKRKNLFKKIGFYVFNIALFLITLWFSIPMGLLAHGFYGEIFNSSPQKTKAYSKKIRVYYASYQGG